MKKIQILAIAAMLLMAACNGNSENTAGDSTGTGAGGARVPGMVTKDTTKHDSAGINKDTTHADSTKR